VVAIGPKRAVPIDDGVEPGAEAGAADTVLPAPVTAGSAAITARLRQAIVDGTYADGERLPAERDLARHFDASRSTVREALRRLEEMNLVTRRIGSGTFVTHLPPFKDSDIAEITSPIELIDVRLAVEPQMARLAVVNATARDIERMDDALGRVEKCGDDREDFSRADEAFHLALAECTRNPLMVWLYRQINDVRSHAQWDAMKDQILTRQRITQYNRQHRALYEAFRSRDAETAVRVITEHLERAPGSAWRRHRLGDAPEPGETRQKQPWKPCMRSPSCRRRAIRALPRRRI